MNIINENPNQQKVKTILIIDDDPIFRALTHFILKHEGYQILEAENGEDGWNIFQSKKEKINLILLDLVMPKKNGYEFLSEFAHINPLPNVPIVIVTGQDWFTAQLDKFSNLITRTLIKPVDNIVLTQVIRDLLT